MFTGARFRVSSDGPNIVPWPGPGTPRSGLTSRDSDGAGSSRTRVLLVLVIGFIVWVMAHDSLAWYGYLGEAAFLCLLIVLVVGMVGPPLHRAPAVAVSPAGVVVGG